MKWKVDEESFKDEPKRFRIDERYIKIGDKVRERLRFVEHPDISPNVRVFYTKIRETDKTFGEIFGTHEKEMAWDLEESNEEILTIEEARKLVL